MCVSWTRAREDCTSAMSPSCREFRSAFRCSIFTPPVLVADRSHASTQAECFALGRSQRARCPGQSALVEANSRRLPTQTWLWEGSIQIAFSAAR